MVYGQNKSIRGASRHPQKEILMKKNIGKLRAWLTLFASILAVLGMLSFVSCGSDDDDDNDSSGKNTEQTDGKNGGTQTDDSNTNPPASPTGSLSVTFYENNGTESSKTVTKTLSMDASLPTAESLEFSKDGYSSSEWGTSADATEGVGGQIIGETIAAGKTTLNLYAIWEQDGTSAELTEYYVGSIVLADGTILSTTEQYTQELENTNPAVGIIAFSKSQNNYTSKKWYEEPHLKATSKKDVYMIGLYKTRKAYANTGAEGASKAIAPCSVSNLTSVSYADDTGTTPTFTGEVDGSKFYDTLKSKVNDAETSGTYPMTDFAQNYCTEGYWSSISWSSYGGVAIPSDSAYASGWYVPSIAELYAIYYNDTVLQDYSLILQSLDKVQKIRKKTVFGVDESRGTTYDNDYTSNFYIANSSSDSADGTKILQFQMDKTSHSVTINEIEKTVSSTGTAASGTAWVIHSLE